MLYYIKNKYSNINICNIHLGFAAVVSLAVEIVVIFFTNVVTVTLSVKISLV